MRKSSSKARRLSPLAELQALGRFILLQQRGDRSFASKYSLAEGSEDILESLYYPGEAVLGLLALYELDRSPAWLTAATKGLAFLARSRRDLSQLPADHWAVIVSARLISICDKAACIFLREELLRHAWQICASILRENVLASATVRSEGSALVALRTTPVATRVEGLLAASIFLPGGQLRDQIRSAIERSIFLLAQAQIASGNYAGGISSFGEKSFVAVIAHPHRLRTACAICVAAVHGLYSTMTHLGDAIW